MCVSGCLLRNRGKTMRRRQGDQFILFLAFTGAVAVVICLLGPEYSVDHTMDMIMSFWDFVLQRNH